MLGLRIGAASAAALAAAAVAGSSWAGAGTAANGGATTPPRPGQFNPGQFNNPQPNAYFPIRPGTVFRYRGTDGGRKFHEKVVVTHRKKSVDGVTATVLRDVLRRADGSLAEKTFDWYADDNDGNVWYVGENTATYDRHGHVNSREGSWQAGVHGARAGLIMPADPHPTDAYRQEYWRGHAEDQAWIVRRHGRVTVPLGHVKDVVRSYEWSRLEPHAVSVKLYGPHLGIVKEWDVSGGSERFVLVHVSRP